MKIETSKIIDARINAGTRDMIFNHMKHELFYKIADTIQFPSGQYLLTLQMFDAPFGEFGRRISICAEIKKDATIRDDVIRLPSLDFCCDDGERRADNG